MHSFKLAIWDNKKKREYQIMGKQIDENFIKTYSDNKFQHTAMVNHRGTVISFAMDDKRRIYYAVLDIGKEDKNKGSLDVKYWVDNPQPLSFPEQIEQVGYAVVNPVQMPTVKKGTRLEATVSQSEVDAFLSTTARLTADAPFQVFSDNQHIYLFRQSLAGDHADMVYKLKSGESSGTETDQTKFVTDKKVPLVTETLLVDRFILAGTELKIPREVRFRRSENRTSPASAKDSLGAKDMEGNAFYETTKELDFIRNLAEGCFSVILLPTQVADIERWQIFAFNKLSKEIESFNIERAEDGFFNVQGTQLYTSPDPQYKASVLERSPGSCPFTGRALVPNDSLRTTVSTSGYAKKALQFDGSNGYVTLPTASKLSMTNHDFTVETWVKINSSATATELSILGNDGNTDNQTLHLMIRDGKAYMGFHANDLPDPTVLTKGTWYHLAFRYTATSKEQAIFVNGNLTSTRTASAHYQGTGTLNIGKWGQYYLHGDLDEVGIWNRARSDAEIKQTMNHRLFGNEFGLAGYWRFDEGTEDEVKDLTGNGSHGKLSGTGVKWVDSDAPIGEPIKDQTGMQRSSFTFGDRTVDTGLTAKLYYQQEKESSAADAKSVKQNARVLLTAVTSGLTPHVPVREGLVLYVTGESYQSGNQWDDLSGQARHAFTKYGEPMPSLHQVANYNGKNFPVMRFSSGPDMTIANNLMDAPFTAIIVDRYTDLRSINHTLASAAENRDGSHWHLGKRYGKNLFYTEKGGDRVYVGQAEDAVKDVFSINTGTIEGTNANWYLDGVNKGSKKIPGSVKGRLSIGQTGLEADIACVLIWKRVLTNKERQTVEQWLGSKYGIGVNHNINLTDSAKKYVAALDVSVSREGKLAQMPDTIPVPALLTSDPGGLASEGILGEISSLEGDIPRLNDEITTLNTQIEILTSEIESDESEVASLPTLEADVKQLKKSIAFYKKPRKATFYEHKDSGGSSFDMFINEEKSYVGNSWNDKISSMSWVDGVKIEAYDAHGYGGWKWVIPGGDNGGKSWNDTISSIKVLEADWLKNSRVSAEGQLPATEKKVIRLKDLRDNSLFPKRTRKRQQTTLLQTKQQTLNVKKSRLTELRSVRFGTLKPQPMTATHTDPQGLTVSSGLLGFAYTDSQPYLFDSALGRMALYFKGLNKQFFSAYYDINTARAKWSLAAESGSLTLVSHASDSWANESRVVVANGGDADHCAVTLSNTKTGLTETWNDVPREVNAFAQVLNGEVSGKIFVGKQNNDLSGAAITTIDLKDGLPHEAPARSTLIFGDSIAGSSQLKMTVSAKATSGSKQINVKSTTYTISADAKVYLLLYDYAANASSNRTGDSLDKGSIQVNVVVGSATGKVSNATASPIAEAQSPQWVADAPGSALYFDGKDDYLDGTTHKTFEHEGDITMEAWVRPTGATGDTRLIHYKSGASHYSLGLRQQALNSAFVFDGNKDYIEISIANKIDLKNQDFTVEAWVKPHPDAPASEPSEQPVLGSSGHGNNQTLHLVIRDGKPYMGFHSNDLEDPTVLSKGSWYHLTFRYTAASKQQAIFVNGDLTSTRTAPAHYQGTGKLYIGRYENYHLDGAIDELRIWHTARDAKDIKSNMSRRLSGQEPGLTAYYHFEKRDANDRSGNGHHGTLYGDLISRDPVASPLSSYVCFASVGDDAIATTEPIVSRSWHHFSAVYNQSYALKFNGDDFGDAGNESMLNITEDLTIEAFVELDTLGRKQGIVSKGIMDNGDGGSVPYAFYIDEIGKLVLEFEDEDGKNYKYSSLGRVRAGVFEKVAVVRKIGTKKIEKTGTTTIKYNDNGTEKTRDVKTIESIDFVKNYEVSFYMYSMNAGYFSHTGKKPIGNNSSLYLGQCYIAGQQRTQFLGTISEIRIWNVARPANDVNTNLNGSENGLTAWWRFEENTGNIAYDAKGGNHVRISGAQWVKTTDPEGSSFVIYRDGKEAAKKIISRPAMGDNQFTVGARKQSSYKEHYKGNLEEIRIWKTARRKEEILDNLFTRLKGEKKDLIASYSFDDISSTEVKDSGLKSNHLTLPTTADHQPIQVLSTAPISNDTAQVRSAMSGVKTDFHEQISGRPAAAEYADMQRLEDTTLIGVHKRCYAYTKNGKWLLSTGYKVGNLVTEWIGQAQFDPQVTGYIEGAPPVPSENLTEGYYQIKQTFNGTSEVTINESESVNYSVSTSKESGFSSGFEMEAKLGLKLDPRIILAPLGIGMSKKFEISMASTFNLGMEANGHCH